MPWSLKNQGENGNPFILYIQSTLKKIDGRKSHTTIQALLVTCVKVQMKIFLLLNLKEQLKSGRSPFTIS